MSGPLLLGCTLPRCFLPPEALTLPSSQVPSPPQPACLHLVLPGASRLVTCLTLNVDSLLSPPPGSTALACSRAWTPCESLSPLS